MCLPTACIGIVWTSLLLAGCPDGVKPAATSQDQDVDPNTPDAARNASPGGTCAHAPDDRTLGLIEQAGITWVRTSFNWHLIEPVRGQHNREFMDERVAAMRSRDISIFATIKGTPTWAADYTPKLAYDVYRGFIASPTAP